MKLFHTSSDTLFSKVTTLVKDILYYRWGDAHRYTEILEIYVVLFGEELPSIKGREEKLLDMLIMCLVSFLYFTISHQDSDRSQKKIIKMISSLCKILTKQRSQTYKTYKKRLVAIKETLTGDHPSSSHVTKMVKCVLEKRERQRLWKLQLTGIAEPQMILLAMTFITEVNIYSFFYYRGEFVLSSSHN